MKTKSRRIYELTTEDVQTVALEELGRELTFSEIKSLEDTIAEKINWYEAIADSIAEKFKK